MSFLTLKQRIMWRVYTIWAARAVLSRTALKIYILLVILWRSTAYVSYGNVWNNSPDLTDVGGNVRFYSGAFTHTDLTSAVLVLGIILLLAWIIFDLIPSLRKKSETSPE
jgi:hypothetical protein